MKLVFRQRILISTDIARFVFEPAEPLVWIAGQSIRLELPAPGYGTNERRFTISSAPHEANVIITTRRSSSEFKQSLFALQPGDEVDAFGIEGNFSWNSELPAAFVAIGIGITPFYAMLKQRLYQQKPINAKLLYHSKDSPIPFASELDTWQLAQPEFSVEYSDHRVSAASIYKLTPDIAQKILYVSGPEASVTHLKTELVKDYSLDEHSIKTDLFTGNLPNVA